MPKKDYRTYDQRISDLIPDAEYAADNHILQMDRGLDVDVYSAEWNRVYHGIMDRLTLMRGIRRMSWQAA